MKNIWAWLCIGLISGAAQAGAPPSATAYSELIAKAEAGETIDYTALRQAYVASPGYDPYSTQSRALFLDSFKALEAHDCATATAKAKESLKIDYTNFAVHGFLSECLDRAGDRAGAMREDGIRKGLIASLTGSGDGKSTATAYIVVTMSEERALLAVNGVEEDSQALIQSGGRYFDQITGKGEDGNMHTLFFDIDAPFAHLGSEMGAGASK